MTKEQVRQQHKNTALNAIRKIYNPKYNFPYDKIFGDWDNVDSCSEQRERKIKSIIEELENQLKQTENGNNTIQKGNESA